MQTGLRSQVRPGTAPSWVTVGINPANLPGGGGTAGNFNGLLRFQSAASTITVPISVAIGPNVLEQINPLNFTKVFAGQDPVPQVIVAATLGAQIGVNVSAVSGTGGDWLAVSPFGNCCSTPASLAVSVHADPSLVPGTYTGQVLVTNGTNALLVPVNLTIAPAGSSFLDDMPGQLSFTVPVGGVNPPTQFVQVRNEGAGPLNWTMTSTTFNNGNWLIATPSGGTTPSFVTVSIVVANLPGGGNTGGTFVGQLQFLDSTGASVTVPINVTVATPSNGVFRQINGLTFTKPFAGPNPLPQTITAASLGTEFGFNASASAATGGNWLSVSPFGNCCGTPTTLRVSVSAAPDLPVGTYTGEVYLRGGSTGVVVPVTLIVASPATPFFDNLPGQLSFALKTGGPNPPSQQIQVRNGGSGSLPWTATPTTSDGGDWLTVTPQVGTGTGNVIVGVNVQNVPGGGLLVKHLNGQVLFQSGNNTATVPVSLTIGGNNTFNQINPLSFVKTFGGANPLPQIITATSIAADFGFNVSESTATGGDWLSVSPFGNCCGTPRTITVTVNAPSGLPVGSYTGEVILLAGTNTVTVPVTLTVVPAGAAVFDNVQGQMSFSSAVGGADFLPQTVRLRNAGVGTLNWDVVPSTSDSGNWLSVAPLNGTTPANVTVSIIPANLPSQALVVGRVTGQLLFRSTSGNVTVPIYVEIGPNLFAQKQPLTFSKCSGIRARSRKV